MEIKIISTLAIAVLTAICYRMGGSGNYPRWWRPLGVGLGVLTSGLILFPMSKWACVGLLASAGASAGLSTTYFKKKGTDAQWYNWMLVGIALSCATMPLQSTIGHWLGFCIRFIVLTIYITLWSQFQGNAVKEELGRGFGIVATMPLLLI